MPAPRSSNAPLGAEAHCCRFWTTPFGFAGERPRVISVARAQRVHAFFWGRKRTRLPHTPSPAAEGRLRAVWRQPQKKAAAPAARRELRRVQAAHVLTNTLRHNNRLSQRQRGARARRRRRGRDPAQAAATVRTATREGRRGAQCDASFEAALCGPQGKGAVRPVAAPTIQARGEIDDVRSGAGAAARRRRAAGKNLFVVSETGLPSRGAPRWHALVAALSVCDRVGVDGVQDAPPNLRSVLVCNPLSHYQCACPPCP